MVATVQPLSMDRFFWLQAFAARLQELGAPMTPEERVELGNRLLDKHPAVEARLVADALWARWPTESGFVPSD